MFLKILIILSIVWNIFQNWMNFLYPVHKSVDNSQGDYDGRSHRNIFKTTEVLKFVCDTIRLRNPSGITIENDTIVVLQIHGGGRMYRMKL